MTIRDIQSIDTIIPLTATVGRASRRKLIAVYDTLIEIERLGATRKGSRGTYLHCGTCDVLLGKAHDHDCPVGTMLGTLVTILPKFNERAQWVVREVGWDVCGERPRVLVPVDNEGPSLFDFFDKGAA